MQNSSDLVHFDMKILFFGFFSSFFMKNPSFPDKLYPSQRNSTNYTRMHILVFFKIFTPGQIFRAKASSHVSDFSFYPWVFFSAHPDGRHAGVRKERCLPRDNRPQLGQPHPDLHQGTSGGRHGHPAWTSGRFWRLTWGDWCQTARPKIVIKVHWLIVFYR